MPNINIPIDSRWGYFVTIISLDISLLIIHLLLFASGLMTIRQSTTATISWETSSHSAKATPARARPTTSTAPSPTTIAGGY